jgi:hypothetical protein
MGGSRASRNVRGGIEHVDVGALVLGLAAILVAAKLGGELARASDSRRCSASWFRACSSAI